MIYIKTFENYNLGKEEFVEVINTENGNSIICKAKIDTEAYTSNIDSALATQLGLITSEETKRVYNYLGDKELQTAKVELVFSIGESKGRRLFTEVTIADRYELRNQIAIGRKDLERLGLLIDVNKSL